MKKFLIDTCVMGDFCNPNKFPDLEAWIVGLMAQPAENMVIMSSVVYYEERRKLCEELLRHAPHTGNHKWAHELLEALDEYRDAMTYLSLDKNTTKRASQMWADARRQGRATAAHKHSLDCDLLIAAQAIEWDAVVVTENRAHLTSHGARVMGCGGTHPDDEPSTQD